MIHWWENDEWLGKKDLVLALLAAARFRPSPRVLEIGLWRGGWALHVAKNVGCAEISAIDPYPGLDEVRSATQSRFAALGVMLRLHADWDDCSGAQEFDLIHVDGEHSEAAALRDLMEAAERLSEGGLLIVDDWLQPAFVGVNAAVNRFLAEEHFRLVLTTESKAYLASAAVADEWREYFAVELEQLGSIPFELDSGVGLGSYTEARTAWGSQVIVALGKPTGLLVTAGERSQTWPTSRGGRPRTSLRSLAKRIARLILAGPRRIWSRTVLQVSVRGDTRASQA